LGASLPGGFLGFQARPGLGGRRHSVPV